MKHKKMFSKIRENIFYSKLRLYEARQNWKK